MISLQTIGHFNVNLLNDNHDIGTHGPSLHLHHKKDNGNHGFLYKCIIQKSMQIFRIKTQKIIFSFFSTYYQYIFAKNKNIDINLEQLNIDVTMQWIRPINSTKILLAFNQYICKDIISKLMKNRRLQNLTRFVGLIPTLIKFPTDLVINPMLKFLWITHFTSLIITTQYYLLKLNHKKEKKLNCIFTLEN
eukprot:TRINITY_DN1890_c0_g3_i11.p3 TRINITY_DN1890_c0_g3~~TRINITY_DN1890_c0_g3_i11.p3  ORF type:complete len:191 (+),score=-10.24 TRINITY_DN1890_c0_g3_i11:243-815(+)